MAGTNDNLIQYFQVAERLVREAGEVFTIFIYLC